MPQLQHIEIHKLKNVATGTSLKFGPKGAVLLGKNGAGKTTLLNAIVAMCRCDYQGFGDYDFRVSFSLKCDNGTLVNVTMEASSNPRLELTSSSDMHLVSALGSRAKNFTFSLSASHNDETLEIRSTNSETFYSFNNAPKSTLDSEPADGWMILISSVLHDKKGKADNRSSHAWVSAGLELYQLSNTLRRFDESLELFQELTNSRGDGFELVVQRFATNPSPPASGMSWYARSLRLATRDVVQGFIAALNEGDTELILASGDSFSYLQQFCRLTGFDQVNPVITLDRKTDEGTQTYNSLNFFIHRGDNWFRHDYLSYGQKRLLCFLYYLEINPSIAVADELVNGMHYDWIAHCSESITNRQRFLSSQNPLLFDFMSFESANDVACQFIECALNENHEFTWRNMPQKDACVFYDSYQVGIQHISEILRTHGYW